MEGKIIVHLGELPEKVENSDLHIKILPGDEGEYLLNVRTRPNNFFYSKGTKKKIDKTLSIVGSYKSLQEAIDDIVASNERHVLDIYLYVEEGLKVSEERDSALDKIFEMQRDLNDYLKETNY